MKVTEKKFLNVHQTLSPLLPAAGHANGVAAVSAKDLEAAKAAAVATAADKVMVSVCTGPPSSEYVPWVTSRAATINNLGSLIRLAGFGA